MLFMEELHWTQYQAGSLFCQSQGAAIKNNKTTKDMLIFHQGPLTHIQPEIVENDHQVNGKF